MADREPLEPLFVTAAELMPPPGTADVIRRRARGIRRRRRATLSAGSVAAASLLFLQLGHVEGTSSLRPANDPVTMTVAPAPTPSTRGTAPISAGPPGQVTGSHQQPLLEPALPRTATSRPVRPPAVRPMASTEPYGTFRIYIRTAQVNEAPTSGLTCDTSAGWSPGPGGWCLKTTDYSNDKTAAPTNLADQWWLGVWMCRPPRSGSGTVDFTPPPHLRVRTPSGALVFDSRTRWRGQSPVYAQNPPGQVAESTCQYVAVGWDSRDDAGVLVPEGRYTYDVDFGDATFQQWNTAHGGPEISVTYGNVH
jgi:hypothetical protein